jgi:hypothetical protein
MADLTLCICEPCESGWSGHPFIEHCAACCRGSLIESYNHHCPVNEHREMAVAQWGEWPSIEDEGSE